MLTRSQYDLMLCPDNDIGVVLMSSAPFIECDDNLTWMMSGMTEITLSGTTPHEPASEGDTSPLSG